MLPSGDVLRVGGLGGMPFCVACAILIGRR